MIVQHLLQIQGARFITLTLTTNSEGGGGGDLCGIPNAALYVVYEMSLNLKLFLLVSINMQVLVSVVMA